MFAQKEDTIVHLHTHGEESTLDGLNKVGELVERAVKIGSPALALTDHGVMGGVPDFITACNKQGIKPIPGMEAYHSKDRNVRGPQLEEMREKICKKYKILNSDNKIKKKAFNEFVSKVKKDIHAFETEATFLLKDYLMDEPMDLFDLLDEKEELSPEQKLTEFKEEIMDYLDYAENHHLLLLAVNNQGLQDLYKISSDAHIHGFYNNPRTDLTYIRENNLGKNIIATSACLGGRLSYLVFQNKLDEAKAFIQECKETFHSFYLEKQATHIKEQYHLNQVIDQLAKETNTPKIITTDAHFARKEDHKIHDILVAGSMGKCVQDEDRYIYSEDHYLKTVDEIREGWNDEEAIQNTLKIAEQVHVTLPTEPLLPKFPVEEGDDIEEILKKKAWDALFQYCIKRPGLHFNTYASRLSYELDVICNEGFTDYFLITEDFINYAKSNNYLVGPGRGSAVGSLVCFVLDITTIDPVKYDLIFERFLNPERSSYPDIDIDMSATTSLFTQLYLKKKYGQDHVAQIGTKGTLAARAAIRFVSKALGYSKKGNYELEDAFAKSIPDTPGIKLKEAYAQEEQVKRYAEAYPEWWDAATTLESHVRSVGTHAGGVVISPNPLTELVPLRLDKDKLETTQYDMEWIEKLLVKFDLLTLETLDLIEIAMQKANIIGKIDIDAIDLNDEKIFKEIFQKNRLAGIFQFESDGMAGVIEQLQPSSFEEMGAINALYRPGPMDLIPSYINRKWKREAVRYPFHELEPILEETLGVWIYQEQIMEASRVIGGLSLGHADYIRKAIGSQKIDLINRWVTLMIYGSEVYKKQQIELSKRYPTKEDIPLDSEGKPSLWVDYNLDEIPYVEGGINRGFEEEKLLKLKEDWINFSSYAFNKSHAFAYSKIAIQCAYLKCYYPTEFMAALLTISEGKKDKDGNRKLVKYMRECEEMGIEILPPDINQSEAGWTPVVEGDKKTIRYGLGAITGISHETLEELIPHQPFQNLEDLFHRVERRKINKKIIINLIKSGAFDSIEPNRNKLLREYMTLREEDPSKYKENTTKTDIIQYERDTLGASVTIQSRWEKTPDGKKNIQFTGTLKAIDPFISKKKQEHARVIIQTNEDELNCMIFNRTWMPVKNELLIGQKITVIGNKDGDKLLINKLVNV